MPRFPRIRTLTDCALTIEFGRRIDPAIHQRVLACMHQLEQAALPGQLDVVPTYRSLTVYYDPLIIDGPSVAIRLMDLAARSPDAPQRPSKTVTVPVFYDPTVAPDLEAFAAEAGLTRERVIALHTSVSYRVYMVGFMPGFPYLGLVPRPIALPRLATPRTSVPAGSVGIAGTQTGIYPRVSPGGWRIIGRTPMQICDLDGPRPFLFEPGDEVRFVAIDRTAFRDLSQASP
ncbi:MAG TPA: 5-oxoprolinase subunit PxpB [Nitrospiraceae bacterium]|nr:5-oxoprolinase subunit PxpB [Nitrospiraceae bacterium]